MKGADWSAFDALLEGCQVISPDFRYLYVNDAVLLHAKKQREEILGRTMREVYPNIDQTEMFSQLRKSMQDHVPVQMDNEFTYPDGSSAWFELRFEPVQEGVLILSMDVTERKRVERALVTLSECNQTLVRATDEEQFLEDLCYIAIGKGGYRDAFIAFKRNGKGLEIATCAGGGVFDMALAQLALETGRHAIGKTEDAGLSCLAMPFYVDGQVAGTLSLHAAGQVLFDEKEIRLLGELAIDLGFGIQTLRERARAARQTAMWSATFDAITDIVCVVSTDHEVIAINETGRKVGCLPLEQIVGKKCYELLHGTDAPLQDCPCQESARTRKVATSRLIRQDTVQDLSAWPLFDESGGIEGLVHVIKDVAAQYKAEEALRESERKHATLLANLPGMAYRCKYDLAWTMEFVSQACLELTGYPPEELLGNARRAYGDLIHPDDAPIVWEKTKKAIAERVPYVLEYRIKDARGNEKWVWERGRAIQDENGNVVSLEGFIIDTTEQRSARKQVERTRRLEAVGLLAGGIAHDFNNMLLVINNTADLALEDLPASHPIRSDLHEIRKAGERAASLTKQLLAFSRRQVLEPKIVNLNDVICGLEGMLRRLLGENIVIVTQLATPLKNVRADPSQIEQVLVNLAINARDAMPKGGTLRVVTENALIEASRAIELNVVPGQFVRFSVRDTGTGMSPEARARAFEPFFTTKPKGKGTGLGLATVHGIISQSGGAVVLHSTQGGGTTFDVFLPQAKEPSKPATEGKLDSVRVGGETVLVVEDEAGVRKLIERILLRAGYQVLSASNGVDALAAFGRSDTQIHLLLTDVVMPHMSGKELADRLTAILPTLRVLFMSGYTDNAIVHHGVLDTNIHFIAKPFVADNLIHKIRHVLDER